MSLQKLKIPSIHSSTKISVGMYILYALYAGCMLSAHVEVEKVDTGNGISYTGFFPAYENVSAVKMEDMKMEKTYTDYNHYKPSYYTPKLAKQPKKIAQFTENKIRKLRPEDIQQLSEEELKALTKHKHFDKISLDQIVISGGISVQNYDKDNDRDNNINNQAYDGPGERERVEECFRAFQDLTRMHFVVPKHVHSFRLAQEAHEDYIRPRWQLIEAAFKLVCRDAPKYAHAFLERAKKAQKKVQQRTDEEDGRRSSTSGNTSV
jgi:hypothetical protein